MGEKVNIKTFILILITSILIFLSYSYVGPLDERDLDKSDYSLKTRNINRKNKWSAFKDETKGNFSIHSVNIRAVQGIFTFKESLNILLEYSIKSGKDGTIEFTTTHNKLSISKDLVTPKNVKQLLVTVKKGDKIKIIADKFGSTSSDYGNLRIRVSERFLKLKNFIIPFLWIMFFVFLFVKKYTYIAINSYIIFLLLLLAEKLNFGILSYDTVIAYMFLSFFMTFIFIFVYQASSKFKKYKVASVFSFSIAFCMYIIPLFCVIYALNFETKITKEVLYALFQTNSSESYEFISDYISFKYILLFVFVSALVGFLLFKQEKKAILRIEKTYLIFTLLVFSTVLLTTSDKFRLFGFIDEGFKKYNVELKIFKEVQAKRQASGTKFSAFKKTQGETYIVIIGESLNKKHMGIYGYFRETTPLLSKMNINGELIVFDNAYSSHTQTVPVMKLSLTEASQYNKKNYYDSLSIIEVLRRSGFRTYWLTNQNLYGLWDNMITVIGGSADKLVSINKSIGKTSTTQKYDGALIEEVKKVLAEKTDKNKVIFVHLMGSHNSYSSRYPSDEYSIFKGELKLGEFGTVASRVAVINYYDNSVIYNDYVVGTILKEFQKTKGISGFIYFSDHADDVIGEVGHNPSKFSHYMTQIPMIAWFSNDYKREYSSKYNNILNNTDALYSNDLLYDTMIGIFGIKTDMYNDEHDLTSKYYKLSSKNAKYFAGTKNYANKGNHIYWQKKNAKYLIESNQSSRIYPHRVNSIGKAIDVWNNGFRSFEVDVRFGDNETSTFHMGHNHGVMGVSLDEFLNHIEHEKIEQIWLDFKNLNKSNHKNALARLEYLNKKYNVKKKFIIESSTKSVFFNKFKKAGLYTSYYLPTATVNKLLKKKKIEKIEKLSLKIAKQVEEQKLSAISFDHRIYSFVKQYLEPKMSHEVVYHVWYAPDLADINFKEKLLKNTLYLDDRVKTLLSVFKSQFDL